MTKRSENRATSTRQKVLLLFLGLFIALLLLVFVEGVLGLFGVGDDLLYDDPFVGFAEGSDLFHAKPGTEGRVLATRPQKLLFFDHQEFPAKKEPGTLRIFALGGSTTAGRPYDDHLSFARWLERYLDAAEPSREHEVINAGGISYASYRVALLARELVRYEPDLFVVYTGHNEFLEERSYSDLIYQSERWRSFRVWLSGFRLGALTRMARRSFFPPESSGTLLEDEVVTRLDTFTGLDAYHRDDALQRSILTHFETNLERIFRLAAEYDIGLIFIRPASNLKDFSPFKSEFRAETTRSQKGRFHADLDAGRRLLDAGEWEPALAALERSRSLDPGFAEVQFLIGRALFAEGKMQAAKQAFVLAKELDVAPLRALEAISTSVRESAIRHDLPWIDLPTILEERTLELSGQAILGKEIFLDHVHPDVATHSLIADEILEILVASGAVHPISSWTPELRQEIFDEVLASVDREDYARRDLNLAKVLGWAGKLEEAEAPLLRAAEVLGDDPDLCLNLGVLWLKTGRIEGAVEQLRKATKLAPDSAVAHFNLGVAYGRLGRDTEGIAELQESLRLRPDYAEALHNLGVLYRVSGNLPAAIRSFERALDLDPEVASIHRALGLALQQAGRWQESEASLRRGLALEPTDDADSLFRLGLTLARQGRVEEAEDAYLGAVAADPEHAQAQNNLGLLAAAKADLSSADRYLRKALELDPDYAEAWLNLAVVTDRAGDPELAIEAARRAVDLQPDNARFRLALGKLLLGRGRADEAHPHLEAAKALGAATSTPAKEKAPAASSRGQT